MNELLIIPSSSAFGITMKLELETVEIVLVNNIIGKEVVIYSKNQKKKLNN